jgi:thiamine biosynthesis lipoprotein
MRATTKELLERCNMKSNKMAGIGRRKFVKTGVGFLFLLAGAGLGPILFRNRRVYSMSKTLMGTIGEIQVVHDDEKRAYRAIQCAYEELDRLERLLTFFSDDSDIGRVNRMGFARDVEISHETADLIERALHWSRATGGFFEPGLGKVSAIWDVKHRTEPPPEDQWMRLANRSFSDQIVLRRLGSACRIRLLTPDLKIDLGGIAKGYAADRAKTILSEEGIDQALVRLGGDISTLSGRSESEGWRIGVKNPENPTEIVEVLSLHDQAVATSGSYEQYFVSQGKVYHHLINPKSAMPKRSGFASVSVIGSNCRDTDALATGLFFVSDDEKRRILDTHTEKFDFKRFGA